MTTILARPLGWGTPEKVCRRRGHDLPRFILSDSTYHRVRILYEDGSACGVAYPMPCRRCGALVGPMDEGYPLIVPEEWASSHSTMIPARDWSEMNVESNR